MLVKNIRNVLFDYGNTLVLDPFRSILELQAERFISLIRATRLHIKKSELINAWIQANNETDYPHISHFYQEEKIVENAIQKLQISPTQTLVNNLLSIYRDGFKKVVKDDQRNKHTRKTLLTLKSKGLGLGVLSNERKMYLRIGLKFTGLSEIFDFGLSSEEIGFQKPEVRFFEKALSILGLPSEETLYVGDEPLRDIVPAMKVGMKTALFVRPESESTPWRNYENQFSIKANFRIYDLSQLTELL